MDMQERSPAQESLLMRGGYFEGRTGICKLEILKGTMDNIVVNNFVFIFIGNVTSPY